MHLLSLSLRLITQFTVTDYLKFIKVRISMPVRVVARSKAWVCGRSPADIVGSNPTGWHGCFSVVIVVCCQVEVSVTS